jgi:hypothetical protein
MSEDVEEDDQLHQRYHNRHHHQEQDDDDDQDVSHANHHNNQHDQPGEDDEPALSPYKSPVGNDRSQHAAEEETQIARICRKLSGKWEGYSIPEDKKKKNTQWKNCQLEFSPDLPPYDEHDDDKQAPETTTVIITGTGVSIWKDSEILFDLTGSLDTTDFSFTITKVHKGQTKKLQSSTDYSGSIDFEKKLMQGQYEKGKLVLRRLKSGQSKESKPVLSRKKSKEVAEKLTGNWEGVSTRSDNGSITSWKNVNITFTSGMSQFGGEGISEWKSESGELQQADFELYGKFLVKEGDQRDATIVKVNYFQSKRKEIEFHVHVNVKIAQIEGTYKNGSLSLRRIGDLLEAKKEEEVQPPPAVDTPDASGKQDRVQGYKLFLEAVVLSGVITEKHEKAIEKTRKTYNITDEEHTEVLNSLGVTPESWEDMKNTPKKTCIICYDREINCGMIKFLEIVD